MSGDAGPRWAPQYLQHPCQFSKRDGQGCLARCGALPTRRYINGWFCVDDRPEMVAARNAEKIAAVRFAGGTWDDAPL